jgi:hypothetical protein
MKSGKKNSFFIKKNSGPNFSSNDVCIAGMLETWMCLAEDAKTGSNITT